MALRRTLIDQSFSATSSVHQLPNDTLLHLDVPAADSFDPLRNGNQAQTLSPETAFCVVVRIKTTIVVFANPGAPSVLTAARRLVGAFNISLGGAREMMYVDVSAIFLHFGLQ